jgi:polyhydroxybutyrate depolymerase
MQGSKTPSKMPDVRFISELIDTLEAHYNIDPARIYANGLSNGGGMAFTLSCTLSNRIAAIGAVSAAQSLPSAWCADSTPVPMIAFHGTADPFVPYKGAPPGWLNPVQPFPNITTWVSDWARRNHCAPNAIDSLVAVHVTRREYTRCADNAAVVLYTVKGGGHQWPGGKPIPEWIVGPMSREIDATGVMWKFFAEHPLRSTQTPARQKL